jgi:hypothetical protein
LRTADGGALVHRRLLVLMHQPAEAEAAASRTSALRDLEPLLWRQLVRVAVRFRLYTPAAAPDGAPELGRAAGNAPLAC